MAIQLAAAIGCLVAIATPSAAQVDKNQEVVLQEATVTGASLDIQSTVNLKGKVFEYKPDGKLSKTTAIWASANSRYRERFLEVASDREVTGTARRYLSATLDKQKGDDKERVVLRPVADRIVFRRSSDESTIFSPDGPLMAAELDLLQADAFTAAFAGLLPQKPVKIGDQWPAKPAAASELSGVEPIQSGSLNCVLREVKSSDDGTVARVTLAGTLTGPTDQGPTQMTIDGHLLFDLDTQLITYVLMNGRSEIMDSAGRPASQLDGRYELTRRPAIDDPRLSDVALRELVLKPTPETTALLFESSNLAIRFLYPRNWEIKSVTKNVIQLDEPTGGTVRLTVDSTPQPTADKLRGELLTWLKGQKAAGVESSAIESTQLSDARTADRFTARAALSKYEREWAYLVIREGDRSASVAANFVAKRAESLQEDVVALARRLEFLPKSR
jgi:hypothetical protein